MCINASSTEATPLYVKFYKFKHLKISGGLQNTMQINLGLMASDRNWDDVILLESVYLILDVRCNVFFFLYIYFKQFLSDRGISERSHCSSPSHRMHAQVCCRPHVVWISLHGGTSQARLSSYSKTSMVVEPLHTQNIASKNEN